MAGYHAWLAGLLDRAGVADRLVVLYDGANASTSLDHNVDAARLARDIAALLIAP